jgi:uncharacterized protein YunC (DUF1805 family)
VPTIAVEHDGREAGSTGSKQRIVKYDGSSTPIMRVKSNISDRSCGAVIENLIIDGSNQSGNFVAGTVGIRLENVHNCLVRNLTIMNCDVGIEVQLTSEEAFSNRFEHIRMENVTTGIKFTGTGSYKDFSYTTIDDVGISLRNVSSAVGIKIGDTNTNNARLYSAFIKANVWLGSSNGIGLEVNGELCYSIVNLGVEEDSGKTGIGVKINGSATVAYHQSFLLAALLLGSSRRLVVQSLNYDNSITVATV